MECGCKPTGHRFSQRLGLTKTAGRNAGGHRLFDGGRIRDLEFVRHTQELGFSLNEVKELLALRKRITPVPKCKLWEVGKKMRVVGEWEGRLAGAIPQLQCQVAAKMGSQAWKWGTCQTP